MVKIMDIRSKEPGGYLKRVKITYSYNPETYIV